jgi:hypothetical protein
MKDKSSTQQRRTFENSEEMTNSQNRITKKPETSCTTENYMHLNTLNSKRHGVTPLIHSTSDIEAESYCGIL